MIGARLAHPLWLALELLLEDRRTSYHPLMAKLVFGMSQSLDGYVDDTAGAVIDPVFLSELRNE